MTECRNKVGAVLKQIYAFVFKHHLPLALLLATVVGALWPTPGLAFSKPRVHGYGINHLCVILIFLLSGLKLKTDDVKDAFKSWKAILYGVFSILFLTSVVSIEIVKALQGQFGGLQGGEVDTTGTDTNGTTGTDANGTTGTCSVANGSSDGHAPLGPREFSTGLQVFYAVPCTVSSGVVLIAQANGNYALGLLITVFTNMIGIATTPGLLKWLAEFGESARLDAPALLVKLVLTLLVPLLVGKALRYNRKVAEFVGKQRNVLKVTGNILLAMLPWMKISVTSDKGSFDCIMAVSIVALFGVTLVLHAMLLTINSLAALILRLEKPSAKVVVILCSQKTLAIALSVLSYLPASLGDSGLMSVPCIVAHLVQIITDAFLVSAWVWYDKRQELKESGNTLHVKIENEDDEVALDSLLSPTAPEPHAEFTESAI